MLEAMRDSMEVKLEYRCYWHEEPAHYTLRPYCVKVFKQRWYVVAIVWSEILYVRFR